MRTCPKCGEENPDRFRLCGYCGTPLSVAAPSPDVRKTVTIVFSDLKGSTSLGERLDSETLRAVLARYFATMQSVLERHGGTVEKFIGDAVMAVFGLPRLHEDDAVRAVRAAWEMKLALAELNQELEERWAVRLSNRTGVNTGEVVAGDVTTGQRLVTGDTVNTAARLEQNAPELEILLGEATFRLVRDSVDVQPVEPLEVKGKADRVPAYRLLGVRAGEAVPRRLDTKMVGRAAEVAALLQRFGQAVREERRHLVTVIGNAGVGKSRLIAEFLEGLSGRARVVRGRCLPYGEGITFWPLAEVVREAAGITDGEQAGSTHAKIAALLQGDATAEDVALRLTAVMGLTSRAFAIDETFWAARKFLEGLTRAGPLVAVIEDIHWAERTFLDLLEHLVEEGHGAPSLVLCSARHELVEEHPAFAEGRPNATRILLEPLSEAQSEEVVANLLGRGLPQAVRARVAAAAQGNPLFVEQMLSMLIDEGSLRREDGGWAPVGDLRSFAAPPSIAALLAARLDRLALEERSALECGSVVGNIFYQGAVEHLVPAPVRPSVEGSLTVLTGKRLVHPDDPSFRQATFRFDHMLIRDAAYAGLLKESRADLHERFVAWLEETAGESAGEYEEIRGYHLEQAWRYRLELGPLDQRGRAIGARGAELLSSAGRRAFARGDMPAAANLLERAASMLDTEDPKRLSMLCDLGEALLEVGEFARAEAFVQDVTDGAERLGDRRLAADAFLVRLLIRGGTEPDGWAQTVVSEAQRVVPVLEQAGDHAGLAKAWRLVASAHGSLCRYGAAEEALRRAVEQARAAGDRPQETRNLASYALSALYGPMPVGEAISRCDRILEEAPDDRRAEGITMCALAHLHAMEGRFDQARQLYRRARATFEDLGRKVLAASVSLDSGRVEMLADDPVRAELELRPDYVTLQQMGEKYLLSTVAALLAQAMHVQGRDEEALEFSRVSEELTAEDDIESRAAWRRVRGKILARRGQLEEGERLAREAVKLIMQTESPVMQGNALMDLSEVLRVAGRHDEAVGTLREARRRFRRKGDAVSALRAEALLHELGVSP